MFRLVRRCPRHREFERGSTEYGSDFGQRFRHCHPTNTRVENLTAANQVETLSASIEESSKEPGSSRPRPNQLVIHRQGGYGVDLTGNTVIKVDMSYLGNPVSVYLFSTSKYIDARGSWLPAKKVVLKATPVFIVSPSTAISANVILKYTLRHVTSGAATCEEKDDDVVELTPAPVTKPVTLIPEREVSPPIFGLWEANPYQDFNLNIARRGQRPVVFCFDSHNEASDFLAYMKAANTANPTRIGDAKLGFVLPASNMKILTPSELSDLGTAEVLLSIIDGFTSSYLGYSGLVSA